MVYIMYYSSLYSLVTSFDIVVSAWKEFVLPRTRLCFVFSFDTPTHINMHVYIYGIYYTDLLMRLSGCLRPISPRPPCLDKDTATADCA